MIVLGYKRPCVYIMSNWYRTVLYTGVTGNLWSRVEQHTNGIGSQFTAKYRCTDIIYFEEWISFETAIHREKQLKRWHRAWKFELIQSVNPTMRDLKDLVFLEYGIYH